MHQYVSDPPFTVLFRSPSVRFSVQHLPHVYVPIDERPNVIRDRNESSRHVYVLSCYVTLVSSLRSEFFFFYVSDISKYEIRIKLEKNEDTWILLPRDSPPFPVCAAEDARPSGRQNRTGGQHRASKRNEATIDRRPMKKCYVYCNPQT